MESFRADLHCHSVCSDGSDDPMLLLEKAKAVNLQGLSITDHDTLDAYSDELFQKAHALSIRMLPGIEISSEQEGQAVHVLGYGYDLKSVSFHLFLQEIKKRRTERNRVILKKLADRGMKIEEADLQGKLIGRPHIALALIKKGYVSSLKEAFDRFLQDGACCWTDGFRSTPLEAIEEIHKAGGKAVLAHPHIYKKKSLLIKLIAYPFDGIECYYSLMSKALEAPWLQIAKEKGWIATGGSDYHGLFKPNIPLGASWVSEETFNILSS